MFVTCYHIGFVENDRSHISRRIRELRQRRGLSQERLSRELKVTPSYVSLIENGEREPSEKVLERLKVAEFKALGTDGQFNPGQAKGEPRYVRLLSWAQAAGLLSCDCLPADGGEKFLTDIGDPEAFAVIIGCDCMVPDCESGSVALLMPCVRPRNGCLVIANMVHGGPLLRIWTMNDANGVTFRLSPRKEQYLALDATMDDVHWLYPVASIHKEVW